MGLSLEEAADAFGALAAGRSEALVELLDAQVAWIEYLGARRSRSLHGADAVAGLLHKRIGEGRTLELTGIAKGDAALEIGYSEPWWLERRGLGAQLAYYLLGDARQTASVGDRIQAIECRATYFAPRAFEIADPAQPELIGLLRR
jgi:hypothetical protein